LASPSARSLFPECGSGGANARSNGTRTRSAGTDQRWSRDRQPKHGHLTRLVAHNHERTAEESRGLIRWLRPEYRNPAATTAGRDGSPSRPPLEEQTEIALPDAGRNRSEAEVASQRLPEGRAQRGNARAPISTTLAWPDKLPARVAQIRALLPETGPDAAALSARFGRANKKREEQIEGILETLRGLGL
jgi:hypothetical protein